MADRPTIVFLHVGWAREYRGDPGDVPQGKFGFLKTSAETGGETFNFRSYGERCYGYAPHYAFDMRRLGAPGDEYVDGVLIIWTATNPDQTGRFIVGWYKDARVYAAGEKTRPEAGYEYVVTEAAAEDCHLIPVDQRTFFVPRMASGYPGISSAFYASQTLSPEDIAELNAYVAGKSSTGFYKGPKPVPPKPAGKDWPPVDNEDRQAVEVAAVRVVTDFYNAQGWLVASVEKDNRGWDLEVTKGARLLLIEVKGRGGSGAVNLTPNEYGAMQAPETRMSYRLAIVFAATSNPSLTIFEFAPGKGQWLSEDGKALKLTPATSALATY